MNMRIVSAKLSLAAIPVSLLTLSAILTQHHGPYYLRNNFDPEYNYLLNSLNLLTLHSPAHTDHPGTTLQILGAAVVWLQWLGGYLMGRREALREAVLSHPEEYLRGMNFVLNVLISGALYRAASAIHRVSKSITAAMLLQITVLVYLQTFIALTRVSPEPLLIAAALALMIPMAPMVLSREGVEANGGRLAAAAGVLFGFGLITKVTFAPLAAVVLLFPHRKRRFAWAAASTVLLLLLPIAPRLPAMASWLGSLVVHSGQYGQGRIGIPEANAVAANIISLWPDQLPLFLFLGLYAMGLFRRVGPKPDGERRLLIAACIAIAAEGVMVAKHPATHYLVPALVLTAFVNAALWRRRHAAQWSWR
ncbi:MAG TPA: hypothetical protein VH639_13380 [Bryobacteraceae bacterium]